MRRRKESIGCGGPTLAGPKAFSLTIRQVQQVCGKLAAAFHTEKPDESAAARFAGEESTSTALERQLMVLHIGGLFWVDCLYVLNKVMSCSVFLWWR